MRNYLLMNIDQKAHFYQYRSRSTCRSLNNSRNILLAEALSICVSIFLRFSSLARYVFAIVFRFSGMFRLFLLIRLFYMDFIFQFSVFTTTAHNQSHSWEFRISFYDARLNIIIIDVSLGCPLAVILGRRFQFSFSGFRF